MAFPYLLEATTAARQDVFYADFTNEARAGGGVAPSDNSASGRLAGAQMLQDKRCISDFSRWWFFGHPGIAGCVMGRLSGDGLWQAARDWLCLRAHVFRLEIADSHIIGDLMNLTATGRLY